MNISLGLSMLVTGVGLLLFRFVPGRASTVGLVMFGSGLTAFLLQFGGEATLHIGR